MNNNRIIPIEKLNQFIIQSLEGDIQDAQKSIDPVKIDTDIHSILLLFIEIAEKEQQNSSSILPKFEQLTKLWKSTEQQLYVNPKITKPEFDILESKLKSIKVETLDLLNTVLKPSVEQKKKSEEINMDEIMSFFESLLKEDGSIDSDLFFQGWNEEDLYALFTPYTGTTRFMEMHYKSKKKLFQYSMKSLDQTAKQLVQYMKKLGQKTSNKSGTKVQTENRNFKDKLNDIKQKYPLILKLINDPDKSEEAFEILRNGNIFSPEIQMAGPAAGGRDTPQSKKSKPWRSLIKKICFTFVSIVLFSAAYEHNDPGMSMIQSVEVLGQMALALTCMNINYMRDKPIVNEEMVRAIAPVVLISAGRAISSIVTSSFDVPDYIQFPFEALGFGSIKTLNMFDNNVTPVTAVHVDLERLITATQFGSIEECNVMEMGNFNQFINMSEEVIARNNMAEKETLRNFMITTIFPTLNKSMNKLSKSVSTRFQSQMTYMSSELQAIFSRLNMIISSARTSTNTHIESYHRINNVVSMEQESDQTGVEDILSLFTTTPKNPITILKKESDTARHLPREEIRESLSITNRKYQDFVTQIFNPFIDNPYTLQCADGYVKMFNSLNSQSRDIYSQALRSTRLSMHQYMITQKQPLRIDQFSANVLVQLTILRGDAKKYLNIVLDNISDYNYNVDDLILKANIPSELYYGIENNLADDLDEDIQKQMQQNYDENKAELGILRSKTIKTSLISLIHHLKALKLCSIEALNYIEQITNDPNDKIWKGTVCEPINSREMDAKQIGIPQNRPLALSQRLRLTNKGVGIASGSLDPAKQTEWKTDQITHFLTSTLADQHAVIETNNQIGMQIYGSKAEYRAHLPAIPVADNALNIHPDALESQNINYMPSNMEYRQNNPNREFKEFKNTHLPNLQQQTIVQPTGPCDLNLINAINEQSILIEQITAGNVGVIIGPEIIMYLIYKMYKKRLRANNHESNTSQTVATFESMHQQALQADIVNRSIRMMDANLQNNSFISPPTNTISWINLLMKWLRNIHLLHVSGSNLLPVCYSVCSYMSQIDVLTAGVAGTGLAIGLAPFILPKNIYERMRTGYLVGTSTAVGILSTGAGILSQLITNEAPAAAATVSAINTAATVVAGSPLDKIVALLPYLPAIKSTAINIKDLLIRPDFYRLIAIHRILMATAFNENVMGHPLVAITMGFTSYLSYSVSLEPKLEDALYKMFNKEFAGPKEGRIRQLFNNISAGHTTLGTSGLLKNLAEALFGVDKQQRMTGNINFIRQVFFSMQSWHTIKCVWFQHTSKTNIKAYLNELYQEIKTLYHANRIRIPITQELQNTINEYNMKKNRKLKSPINSEDLFRSIVFIIMDKYKKLNNTITLAIQYCSYTDLASCIDEFLNEESKELDPIDELYREYVIKLLITDLIEKKTSLMDDISYSPRNMFRNIKKAIAEADIIDRVRSLMNLMMGILLPYAVLTTTSLTKESIPGIAIGLVYLASLPYNAQWFLYDFYKGGYNASYFNKKIGQFLELASRDIVKAKNVILYNENKLKAIEQKKTTQDKAVGYNIQTQKVSNPIVGNNTQPQKVFDRRVTRSIKEYNNIINNRDDDNNNNNNTGSGYKIPPRSSQRQ